MHSETIANGIDAWLKHHNQAAELLEGDPFETETEDGRQRLAEFLRRIASAQAAYSALLSIYRLQASCGTLKAKFDKEQIAKLKIVRAKPPSLL